MIWFIILKVGFTQYGQTQQVLTFQTKQQCEKMVKSLSTESVLITKNCTEVK